MSVRLLRRRPTWSSINKRQSNTFLTNLLKCGIFWDRPFKGLSNIQFFCVWYRNSAENKFSFAKSPILTIWPIWPPKIHKIWWDVLKKIIKTIYSKIMSFRNSRRKQNSTLFGDQKFWFRTFQWINYKIRKSAGNFSYSKKCFIVLIG